MPLILCQSVKPELSRLKMLKIKEALNKIGFIDLTFRDEDNELAFKRKQQRAGSVIEQFEQFLKDKYGITGFSAHDSNIKLKKGRKKSVY